MVLGAVMEKVPKQKMTKFPSTKKRPLGEGAGGGGGMYARAKGVFEITETGTRFIPADTTRQILTGIAIGFLLKSFFFKKGKR